MFSERLIKIIADLGTHNGVIAGYAKLDRSSISRLRSGSRWVAPDSDPPSYHSSCSSIPRMVSIICAWGFPSPLS